MKIVTPSVEIMRSSLETDPVSPEQFIERVGRTCYKSEDKITVDSAAKFVGNLIKRGHEAMIEHWSLIFKADAEGYTEILSDYDQLLHDGNITLTAPLRPYIRFTDWQTDDGEMRCIISGNMRAWRDYARACVEGFGFMPKYMHSLLRDYPLFFPEYVHWVSLDFTENTLTPISANELTESERKVHQDITMKFVCDRGVSHEIVRHRVASFAQESTRYCNYSGDKFGKEITVIEPVTIRQQGDATPTFVAWYESCKHSENRYFDMLDDGASPQVARSVLPNSLKTEIIVTMTLDNWEHFFVLRDDPAAHPDMQEVAKIAHDLYRGVISS